MVVVFVFVVFVFYLEVDEVIEGNVGVGVVL